MKINVIKNDIFKGQKGSANFCPIALSVKRTQHRHVEVDGHSIVVYTKKVNGVYQRYDGNKLNSRYYQLPEKYQTWIQNFDDGKNVKPFSTEVKTNS